MSSPEFDDEDQTSLSDQDIAEIHGIVESGPSVGAPPTVGPKLSRLIARSVEALSSSDSWTRTLAALDDMTVPPTIFGQLEPYFKGLNFTVTNERLLDRYNLKKIRRYTAAARADFKLAVLHLPDWFLLTPDTVGSFKAAVESIGDHHGRIISRGLPATVGGYDLALESMSVRDLRWSFVPWVRIEEILDGTIRIEDALKIPPGLSMQSPKPAPGQPTQILEWELKLEQNDQDKIVDSFLLLDSKNPEFYSNLYTGSDWSDEFRNEMRSGLSNDPTNNALRVLKLLLKWNRYGAPSKKAADTYLGWVLLKSLKLLGDPAGKDIANIIIKYHLVASDDDIRPAKDRLKVGG